MLINRKKNFFERRLNILLIFVILILCVLFFFLEWFVPVPKIKVEKNIVIEQYKK
ncbi:MAG: hypothetical protein CFH26_00249 [Alphaproteobacteria bacterium MarineAlpha6_Bin4]|nr:MAG: hypothetical protein CFH25_00627 [Alphaproteobacteria bacterium MarineAlpha6_Bin3]PPR38252.1 MAG: hypothetical protein CFH26_00249 [Alphaproteobacteria bacterium MarineAlpha6_Bin4]|tara:strand:- start:3217 stop:3381 length:165 start_codon:yes stop_codon:yes gene_type:complete